MSNDIYDYHEIYKNTETIIEKQEEIIIETKQINTNIQQLITSIAIILIFIGANIVHHIVDAGWKH